MFFCLFAYFYLVTFITTTFTITVATITFEGNVTFFKHKYRS